MLFIDVNGKKYCSVVANYAECGLVVTGRSIIKFYKDLSKIETVKKSTEQVIDHTADGISTSVSGSDLINNNTE
jgi:hypothetical protein